MSISNIFSSYYLQNNFQSISDDLRSYAIDHKRFDEIAPFIYHGMMVGENARSRGMDEESFYTVADSMGYKEDNLSRLVAFQFGFYIGLFSSLAQAANLLVEEEEDYKRLSEHLENSDMGTISSKQLQSHPLNITYALAFIDSYVVRGI